MKIWGSLSMARAGGAISCYTAVGADIAVWRSIDVNIVV